MKTRAKAALALALLLTAGLLFARPTRAQEAAPPPKPAVKLMFLPPPMEGTISLGIYDSTGKLVRTLHREASSESNGFIKEDNGLATFWDGKDDAGNLLPPGKYSARGFMVGDLQIEGEAFLCNDWASEESTPRIHRITKLGPLTEALSLGVELVDGKTAQARCASSGTVSLVGDSSAEIGNQESEPGKGPITELKKTAIASSPGKEESLWVIDHASDGSIEVQQFSAKGEFLRRLGIDPTQPVPTKISASKTADAIGLLEENAQCQRVRWLELSQSGTDAAQPVSTWTETLSKTITFNDRFEQVQAMLKMPSGKPVIAQAKLAVSLVANPLLQGKKTNQEICLGFDSEGSFIKTADGLFLKRITDTTLLKWAVISRDPETKAVVVFQSDGAVVEEYRIGAIGNLMAFDYGDFKL